MAPRSSLIEVSTYAAASMLYGFLLLETWRRVPWWAVLQGGALCGTVGLAAALVIPGLLRNPVLSGESVGESVVVNDLLYVYGMPAVAGLLLARKLHRLAWWGWARFAGIGSIVLLLLLVSLEVRQGFQGAHLDEALPTNAEWYAYSAAWIVFGLALLVVGIASGSTVVRYASLVVVMASAAKVFLFDMRELRNLYRVFSFLGLGVSLFLLSYLYQRFVFRRPGTPSIDG